MGFQASPELLDVPGVMAGLGPGGKGSTPLPTSTASGEAPPSTGVSGASSSRSVARLYSTICQTVGDANRGQAEPAAGPRPCPDAPRPAGALLPAVRAPFLLPASAAWGPPDQRPLKSAARLREPEAPASPPLHQVLGPGARARTHVAAAAQLLQRDAHGGVGAAGTSGLPAAGPRPGRGLGPRPGPTAARHHSRRRSPSLGGRRHPSRPEPPPPAAPPRGGGDAGRGGARPPLPTIRPAPCALTALGARGPPCPAERLAPKRPPQPERAALQNHQDPSPLHAQPPMPATLSCKPPIIYIPMTQAQTLLIVLGPVPQTAGPLYPLKTPLRNSALMRSVFPQQSAQPLLSRYVGRAAHRN